MAGVAEEGRTSTSTRDSVDGGGGEAKRRRPSGDSDTTTTDVDVIEAHAPADIINYSGSRQSNTLLTLSRQVTTTFVIL